MTTELLRYKNRPFFFSDVRSSTWKIDAGYCHRGRECETRLQEDQLYKTIGLDIVKDSYDLDLKV